MKRLILLLICAPVRNDGGAGANFFSMVSGAGKGGEKDHHDLRYEGKESLRDERGPEDLHGDGGDRQVIHQ